MTAINSQLEPKALEMTKIQHHIWKQILYCYRNNFKNMDSFKSFEVE